MDAELRQAAANELLEELAQSHEFAPVRPDEVTAEMLAERIGCTKHHAGNILNDEVKLGRLKAREAKAPNGYKVKAYYKP